MLPDLQDRFHHVIDVTLGIDAARHREAHEFHRCCVLLSGLRIAAAEHQRSDLHGANSCLAIQLHDQGLPREVDRLQVGEERRRIDVNGVPTRWLHDRHARAGDVLAEIGGGGNTIEQVVGVERFIQAGRDGVEIAARQAAIGWEPLGEYQQVLLVHGEARVVGGKEATNVGHPILLRRHGAAVRQRKHFARDVDGCAVRLSFLTQLDEPGILREAAGVDVERDAMLAAHRRHRARIGQRHRLPATRIVGDGKHAHRDLLAPYLGDELFQCRNVHVALERMPGLRLASLGNDQVHRLGAGELDVGTGGIEVGVVGHHVAGLAEGGEEDLLGGAALVGGEHLAEAEDVLHRGQEAEPGAAAGVGFVATHDGRPLLGTHCRGATVSEEVDEHVLRLEQEDVVCRVAQPLLALHRSGEVDGLDGLDLEWLDDGLHGREDTA